MNKVIEMAITNIENEIYNLEKIIKENKEKSEEFFNIFKIAKVPEIDIAKEKYNNSVKTNFYLNKSIKKLTKTIKQLKKVAEIN